MDRLSVARIRANGTLRGVLQGVGNPRARGEQEGYVATCSVIAMQTTLTHR